jgi:hypothetical protein
VSIVSGRQPLVAAAAFVLVVFSGALSSGLILAGYGLDLGRLAEVESVVDLRPQDVGLFRIGALADMLGYILFALVPIHVHRRLSTIAPEPARHGLVGMVTFCGLGWSLTGALAAVLLASVGPHLADIIAAGGEQSAAADVAFGALASAVFGGLFGTLELLFFGLWLAGVGWLARGDSNTFRWLAVIGGVGALGYSARSALTGHPPVPPTTPLDVAILAGVAAAMLWVVWLGVRLWRGR